MKKILTWMMLIAMGLVVIGCEADGDVGDDGASLKVDVDD